MKVILFMMISAIVAFISLALFGIVSIDPVNVAGVNITGMEKGGLLALSGLAALSILITVERSGYESTSSSERRSRWPTYYTFALAVLIMVGWVYYSADTVAAIVFAILSAIATVVMLWYMKRD